MKSEDNHKYHHHHDTKSGQRKEFDLTCPVMLGVPVDKEEAEKEGRGRQYKGKKYYLCCEGCTVDFDTNPEMYAK